MLCDAHTHLSDYPPVEIAPVLERAQQAGVGLVVAAGTTLETSRASVALAQAHPMVYAGVGLHPMNLTGPVDDGAYSALAALARSERKVVCVSEIGLDYLPSSPPRDVQDQAFRRQIRLALELELPVIFHSRESHPEVLRALREEGAGRAGGAMHYFQADLATAWKAIEAGFYISLAKPLMRLPELQAVAAELPLERIVLETDSAPQPWKRHHRNWTEPRDVRLVAAVLAEIKGVSIEEVAATTTANLRCMLKLPPLLHP